MTPVGVVYEVAPGAVGAVAGDPVLLTQLGLVLEEEVVVCGTAGSLGTTQQSV